MSLTLDERGVFLACPACGQKNRVPFGRPARCGKCHAALPGPSEPIEVSSAVAFDALIQSSPLPVIVDFWAEWCGPCRMVAPELVKIAAAHAGEWLLVKVDTEALPDLAQRFQIRSIPTMAVFKGGREAGRTTGARPAAQIDEFVRQIAG
jgi:thioredoxin 2